MELNWFLIVCGMAVLACAVVGGVFLTFSDFVMRSLGAANPAGGIESMQIINRKVYGSLFLAILWAILVAVPLLAGYAFIHAEAEASTWIAAGGVIYVLGVFLVTVVFNVPMNQRLDAMDHSSVSTQQYWHATYLPSWIFWNHVRALASVGAAGCYLVACVSLVRRGLGAS
ncbi:MAG: putative membrane protein [Hyphomicrobiaceae bacterium]|jgi:uncharacterized membrane protein